MFSIMEIARETGALYGGGEAFVSAVSSDTRNLPENCIFVALKGDNFDGHDYIGDALNNGAAFAVAMKNGDYPKDKVLIVNDTRNALLDIARINRKKMPAKVVAVTGSTGKTTTREMIAAALSGAFKTLKTEKNLNNEIGLAVTLLRLKESYGAAVVEAGVDGPGQMERLSAAALPDVAVITNIGVSHIEAFGAREKILSEKLKITSGMPEGATLVLCGDNDLLRALKRPKLNVIKYGISSPGAAVRARKIHEYAERMEFVISYDGNNYNAVIPAIGRHNVLNALAAFSVSAALGVAPEAALKSLLSYEPEGMRQKIVTLNSMTIVEDCYNANPDSMRAALSTLGGMRCNGRRIAVLSDMLELGEISEASHFEAGEFAARCGLDYLLCTGRLSEGYVAGARDSGMSNAFHYETKDDLAVALNRLAKPGDIIWFKASRSMKLETVMQKLYD